MNPLMPVGSAVFFFNDTATTEIYTLSLHDALPISDAARAERAHRMQPPVPRVEVADDRNRARVRRPDRDRKSTRLNSSHSQISYAVFCLKKRPARAWPAVPARVSGGTEGGEACSVP